MSGSSLVFPDWYAGQAGFAGQLFKVAVHDGVLNDKEIEESFVAGLPTDKHIVAEDIPGAINLPMTNHLAKENPYLSGTGVLNVSITSLPVAEKAADGAGTLYGQNSLGEWTEITSAMLPFRVLDLSGGDPASATSDDFAVRYLAPVDKFTPPGVIYAQFQYVVSRIGGTAGVMSNARIYVQSMNDPPIPKPLIQLNMTAGGEKLRINFASGADPVDGDAIEGYEIIGESTRGEVTLISGAMVKAYYEYTADPSTAPGNGAEVLDTDTLTFKLIDSTGTKSTLLGRVNITVMNPLQARLSSSHGWQNQVQLDVLRGTDVSHHVRDASTFKVGFQVQIPSVRSYLSYAGRLHTYDPSKTDGVGTELVGTPGQFVDVDTSPGLATKVDLPWPRNQTGFWVQRLIFVPNATFSNRPVTKAGGAELECTLLGISCKLVRREWTDYCLRWFHGHNPATTLPIPTPSDDELEVLVEKAKVEGIKLTQTVPLPTGWSALMSEGAQTVDSRGGGGPHLVTNWPTQCRDTINQIGKMDTPPPSGFGTGSSSNLGVYPAETGDGEYGASADGSLRLTFRVKGSDGMLSPAAEHVVWVDHVPQSASITVDPSKRIAGEGAAMAKVSVKARTMETLEGVVQASKHTLGAFGDRDTSEWMVVVETEGAGHLKGGGKCKHANECRSGVCRMTGHLMTGLCAKAGAEECVSDGECASGECTGCHPADDISSKEQKKGLGETGQCTTSCTRAGTTGTCESAGKVQVAEEYHSTLLGASRLDFNGRTKQWCENVAYGGEKDQRIGLEGVGASNFECEGASGEAQFVGNRMVFFGIPTDVDAALRGMVYRWNSEEEGVDRIRVKVFNTMLAKEEGEGSAIIHAGGNASAPLHASTVLVDVSIETKTKEVDFPDKEDEEESMWSWGTESKDNPCSAGGSARLVDCLVPFFPSGLAAFVIVMGCIITIFVMGRWCKQKLHDTALYCFPVWSQKLHERAMKKPISQQELFLFFEHYHYKKADGTGHRSGEGEKRWCVGDKHAMRMGHGQMSVMYTITNAPSPDLINAHIEAWSVLPKKGETHAELHLRAQVQVQVRTATEPANAAEDESGEDAEHRRTKMVLEALGTGQLHSDCEGHFKMVPGKTVNEHPVWRRAPSMSKGRSESKMSPKELKLMKRRRISDIFSADSYLHSSKAGPSDATAEEDMRHSYLDHESMLASTGDLFAGDREPEPGQPGLLGSGVSHDVALLGIDPHAAGLVDEQGNEIKPRGRLDFRNFGIKTIGGLKKRDAKRRAEAENFQVEVDEDGHTYYFDRRTNRSTWTKPPCMEGGDEDGDEDANADAKNIARHSSMGARTASHTTMNLKKPKKKKLFDRDSFRNSIKRMTTSKKSAMDDGGDGWQRRRVSSGLEIGWMEIVNEETGEVYYENKATGEMTREQPKSFCTADGKVVEEKLETVI
jgi:hypothetical protein